MTVDHTLVKRFRQEVGDRLAHQRRLDQAGGLPPMTGEDERQFARALIAQVLEEFARGEIGVGRTPPTAEEEEALAAGIHAALFGVGRLQPLLDDPEVENIDINGCDRVFVGYADGREVMGEPVADSDEELVELIQILAAYSGLSSRPFDTANPQLDLRLPDGSRLSAVMDVTIRPAASIRRSRLGKVFLSDLVGNGTLTPELGRFLSAAVAARKNIMIAGSTNAERPRCCGPWPTRSRRPSGSSPSSVPWSSGSTSSPSCIPTWWPSSSGCPTPRDRGRSPWRSWSAAPCG